MISGIAFLFIFLNLKLCGQVQAPGRFQSYNPWSRLLSLSGIIYNTSGDYTCLVNYSLIGLT